MSLSLILPTATAADWQPVSLPFDYKSIFRTAPAGTLAKAGPILKIAAEALTLLGVSAGLFSLFLGLSVL